VRLIEIGLFLLPLACWLVWLRIARQAGPPPATIALMGIALLALGGLLVWFGVREGAPPGSVYHPARLESGRIVPGEVAPR
jgi:hypothetical protein